MLTGPLTISCDAKCQREKNLTLLKSEMEKARGTPQYEQARIKYHTLLEGHGWLAKEKERIAKDELDGMIQGYTSRYQALSGQKKAQTGISNIISALKAEEGTAQENTTRLQKQIGSVQDQTTLLNRMTQLTPPGFSGTSYLPIILDVLIGLLSIVVLYLAYSKFLAAPTIVEEQIAGRRFSRRV